MVVIEWSSSTLVAPAALGVVYVICCCLVDARLTHDNSSYIHCKNIRISTDILCRVVPYFNGTGSVYVAYVSVNRHNNEARAHIAMWARTSSFRRFKDTSVYKTGSVKIWKIRTKYP